jgi:hypothetical protein
MGKRRKKSASLQASCKRTRKWINLNTKRSIRGARGDLRTTIPLHIARITVKIAP